MTHPTVASFRQALEQVVAGYEAKRAELGRDEADAWLRSFEVRIRVRLAAEAEVVPLLDDLFTFARERAGAHR